MKPYKLALIAGRFQGAHLMQMNLVSMGLHNAETVCLLISKEKGVAAPYPFAFIKKCFKKVFPNTSLHIFEVEEFEGDTPYIARFLFNTCKNKMGMLPDLMIYGNEKMKMDWYKEGDLDTVATLLIPEYVEGVPKDCRGTTVRRMLLEKQFKELEQYLPAQLWDDIPTMYTYVVTNEGAPRNSTNTNN